MPCMGPNKPSDAEVEEALASVIETLRDKHGLLTRPEDKLPTPMLTHRRRAVSLLKAAVSEVLWQEACESF